ncbi:MAG: PH domain-containing protein [Steroidobacter sp.]
MAPIEFQAPWSKTLRVATVFSVAMLAIMFCAGLFTLPHAPWFVSALLIGTPLVMLAGALPFMVRGYVLTEDAILVRRLGWETRLPLAQLKSVSGDVEAMRRSIRVFGNGGLFSFTGEFWSRRLGRYRALATDFDRAIVLRYPKRTIVITPHDPQHFIMRARTLMKHAEFERQ